MAEMMKTRTVLIGEPLKDGRERHRLPGFMEPLTAEPGALVLERKELLNGFEQRRFLLTYNGEEKVMVHIIAPPY